MISLFEAWLRWPVAARWISGVVLFLVLNALIPALSDRHPAAAFGENFIVSILQYVVPFGGLALAVFVGAWVTEYTNQTWLGWVVGIALMFAALEANPRIAVFFDVSEQLDTLSNSGCYTEWDGRATTTVCE